MLGALAHRGPDGGGLAVVGRAALGHRRLAIHDLTPAGLPAVRRRAHGLAAVVNGEFYDSDRSARGARRARSRVQGTFRLGDRPPPLAREGPGARARPPRPVRARDRRRDRRHALPRARPRRQEAALLGAARATRSSSPPSSGACARATGARPAARTRCSKLFRMGYVPAPATRRSKGSTRSRQARPCSSRRRGPRVGRWWTPPLEDGSPDRCAGRAPSVVREELRAAVERRLAAERPLGVLLSGGLDSAAVLMLANEIAGPPLPAFTLGFDDPSVDEAPVRPRGRARPRQPAHRLPVRGRSPRRSSATSSRRPARSSRTPSLARLGPPLPARLGARGRVPDGRRRRRGADRLPAPPRRADRRVDAGFLRAAVARALRAPPPRPIRRAVRSPRSRPSPARSSPTSPASRPGALSHLSCTQKPLRSGDPLARLY